MLHVRRQKARRTPSPTGPAGPGPTLAGRLRVHLHRGRLDHQIAEGLDPLAFEDRALRARQLGGMPARRRVARSLRDLVKAAEDPAPLSSAVPVSRRTVLQWREALLGLAERLERPEPVDPCGVARALIVLTNGGGPLYVPEAAGSMGESVWWIADGLNPGPRHGPE